MDGKCFFGTVLSGLCFLPFCFPHTYVLVEQALTWTEAQNYCRMKYTDLATVESVDQMAQLVEAGKKYLHGHLWIGLYLDPNVWKWSLRNEGYYGAGEKDFRNWNSGEPNNHGGVENCAVMAGSGMWNDARCSNTYLFVCINGTMDSYNLVVSAESKSWNNAQSYCREHAIDLASVRNQNENDQIKEMAAGQSKWIGLDRSQWKWSDGSPLSFREWNTVDNEPHGDSSSPCVLLHEAKWEGADCATRLFFVCIDAFVQKKVFRIRVTKVESSWNPEDAAGAILQQFCIIMMEGDVRSDFKDKWDHRFMALEPTFGRLQPQKMSKALTKNAKLAWRKQPDGKIFHREE